MADLYHIYIKPKAGVTMDQIDEKMNLAVHWYRYHNSPIYVIQTTSDQVKWQERLLPLVHPDGFLFICKLDPTHYQGWMKKTFWDWFEPRAKSTTPTEGD
jgi:hypothetical protein